MQRNEDWQLEVGKFVFAFGQMEWATHWALDSLAPEALHSYFRKKQMKERIEVLLLLTKDRADEWEKLHGILGEVKEMLEHRHLIAHNDLWTDVLDNGDFEQRIVSARDTSNSINFDGLVQKREYAEVLARNFIDTITAVLRSRDA